MRRSKYPRGWSINNPVELYELEWLQTILGYCQDCTGNVVKENGLYYCYCSGVGYLLWQAGKWERWEKENNESP